MAYEGGYTSALNSASTRELQAVQAMFERERLREAQTVFAQQQQQQERQRLARMALGNMLPQLAAGGGAGPQPPMPGQSSFPAQMPSPPPQGGMPPAAMPSPGPQGGPPPVPMPSPAMAGQFLTMPPPPAPASPPPGGSAPMPQGGGPGAPMMRSGMNAPGGPPGPGGAPMALPPPPDRWKGLPAGPGGAPGGDGMVPPPPGEGAVMPRSVVSVSDMAKLLSSRGIKGEAAMDMLEQWKPFMDSENKHQFDAMKAENAAQKAAIAAYSATMRASEAARRATETERRDRETASYRRDSLAQRAKQFQQRYGGGDPGKPGVANPPKDASEQTALDVQAWNYLMGKGLPYRKGTGGGKDKNDAVMHRVGEITNELGMSAEQVMSMPADWKANAQSLAFQTKKLDAIEGQLRSFHNNIDTWDSLAQGIAPKIGGERVKAMAKDLEKINFAGVRSFDEAKLKIESQFNDPTVSAYMVAAMAAAMDYARIMQGPQSIASLTEGARKDAERLIAASMDDGARKAVIGTLESDTEGQVKGIRDQLDNIRGRLRSPSKSAGATEKVREFKTEEEAQAANLPKGTRVKINGVTGTWH